jgi:Tol biopolymer transport system component
VTPPLPRETSATIAGGEPADSSSFAPAISADGRYVAFDSAASNLAGWDSNGGEDVFVRDTASGRTTRLDAGGGDAQGFFPGISPDGSYVAFAVAPPDFSTSEYYLCGPLLDDAAPAAAGETSTSAATSTTQPPPTTTDAEPAATTTTGG